MKLTGLRIAGYRSLVDVTLPISPLTVLIGPNGSGKSTVLEIIRLLQDAMQERLSTSLERLGGLNAILSRITPRPEHLAIQLTLDAENPKSAEPMRYTMEWTPTDVSYSISAERLEWHWQPAKPEPFRYVDRRGGWVSIKGPDSISSASIVDFNRAELALAQSPRLYSEPDALRSMLAKVDFYSFLDVGRRAVVRLPQALTPAGRPGANGENLYSALYNLRANHRTVYGRILDILRLAFPGFRELEFPVVGSGQVILTWNQEPLDAPLYPSDLSEGTLRFLWLATTLLAPEPAPLTLIDEPEISLHPELLRILAELLQDAAQRGVVLVATHSSDLIRWLQPKEVVILDKEHGQTRCMQAETLNLGEWLAEYSLADLWLMGKLGGRS